MERKDEKWFKRDIIVLISFLILFVSISFLVNIGNEMSLPRLRRYVIFIKPRNYYSAYIKCFTVVADKSCKTSPLSYSSMLLCIIILDKPWNDKDLWFDHDDVDYWASDDDFTLYETDDIFPVSNENNDGQFRTTDNPPDSLSKDIDKFQHDIENLSTADDKLRTQDVSMGSWLPEAGMGMRHLHRKYKNKHRGCRKHKNKPMAMIKFDQLLKASKESSPQKFEAQVSPESEEITLLDTESQLDFDSDNDSEMDREGNAVMESDGELDKVRNVSANPEAGLLTDAEPRPEPEPTLGPLSESSDEAQAVSKPSITATSHMETAYQTGSETEAQYTEEPSALTAPGSVEETVSEFTEDPADLHGQGYSNQPFVQEITNAGHLPEMLGSKLNPKVLAATKELDGPSTRERVIQPPWFSLKESEDNRFKVESITKPVPRAKGTAFVTERETTSVYFRGKTGAADSRPMVQGSAPEENRSKLCKPGPGCSKPTTSLVNVSLKF